MPEVSQFQPSLWLFPAWQAFHGGSAGSAASFPRLSLTGIPSRCLSVRCGAPLLKAFQPRFQGRPVHAHQRPNRSVLYSRNPCQVPDAAPRSKATSKAPPSAHFSRSFRGIPSPCRPPNFPTAVFLLFHFLFLSCPFLLSPSTFLSLECCSSSWCTSLSADGPTSPFCRLWLPVGCVSVPPGRHELGRLCRRPRPKLPGILLFNTLVWTLSRRPSQSIRKLLHCPCLSRSSDLDRRKSSFESRDFRHRR